MSTVLEIETNGTLNPKTDILLGERDIHVNYRHVVSETIYVHIPQAKENKKVFYIYYFMVKNGKITKYIRRIRKETAVIMLSRIHDVNENAVNEIIPDFETEKLKIQLFDRLNDFEKLLPDEDILKSLNQVLIFNYYGHHVKCSRNFPHPPHIVDFYNTVRYGELPVYCTGKEGKILLKNGKKVQLLISKNCSESCTGHYIFFELLEE